MECQFAYCHLPPTTRQSYKAKEKTAKHVYIRVYVHVYVYVYVCNVCINTHVDNQMHSCLVLQVDLTSHSH